MKNPSTITEYSLSHTPNHAFYAQNKTVQWIVAIGMLLLMLTIIGFWTALVFEYFLLWASIFLVVPFIQFLATPSFTLFGVYRYVSPMLLMYMPTAERVDLHNGTSFDYLFALRKIKGGKPLRHTILRYYIRGLLEIVRRVETGAIPETATIRGTSYFFSSRTVSSFGFETKKAPSAERLNIVMNYLDLLWMYSIAHGKLTFPKLKRIQTAEIKGAKLVEQKEHLERMLTMLNRKK